MITTKIAASVAAGVLSVAVTGAVAFAAVQAPSPSVLVASTDTGAAGAARAEKGGEALQAILAKLVTEGTITQAQADAVLGAVRTAAEEAREKAKEKREKAKENKDKAKERDADRIAAELLKRVLGNMLKQSVEYIGLPHEAVAAQLKAGKSLAEIAATQPGKTREGLIAHITSAVTAHIDKAVADGKVGAERAAEAKTKLSERVAKFVDHTYERKPSPPKDKERKPAERGEKRPAASPTAKPTT